MSSLSLLLTSHHLEAGGSRRCPDYFREAKRERERAGGRKTEGRTGEKGSRAYARVCIVSTESVYRSARIDRELDDGASETDARARETLRDGARGRGTTVGVRGWFSGRRAAGPSPEG